MWYDLSWHIATHTATHCNTLQHTHRVSTRTDCTRTFTTTTLCNTLQHTATHVSHSDLWEVPKMEILGGVESQDALSLCHFLQKSLIIIGSFAGNDLQLKTSYESSPSCMLRVMQRICMCRVTHTHVLCRACAWVMSRKSHVTHMNDSCCTYEWDMSQVWMIMSHTSE